jgi:ribosomal protein S18 acetylase RimI-like enzyme
MSEVSVRRMSNEDLAACIAISEPLPERAERIEEELSVYPTLVAEIDGAIVGYTQFSLGPDKILHSLAFRVASVAKGQGVGSALMKEKVRLAKICGARMHMYAVAKDGEVALKKILERQGMHPCQDHGEIIIYVSAL